MEEYMPPSLESVLEFLGSIPLLQRLPSSSVKKIADVINFKKFDKGEYLVHKDEAIDGLYFIWKGEAEVSMATDAETLQHTELSLKMGDYFGYGHGKEVGQIDIIALTEVICLVLNHKHLSLLSAESTWHAAKDAGSCPEVEHIVQLESIDVDIFRGFTPRGAIRSQNVFGGQLISQALAAASKSVNPLMVAHSLHSYFLQTGDVNLPIIYHVRRVRDGRSFSTRHVEAMQKGLVIFTLDASFQKPGVGFEHQEPMPPAPTPESLRSMEDVMDSYITDPRIPISNRNTLAKKYRLPYPFEIRFCDSSDVFNKLEREPRLMYWLKARGKLSDDPALHRCVAAYASDLVFLEASARPHHKKGEAIAMLSLDHSMWFHKPFKADDWLLFVMESPIAGSGRGFSTGRMYKKSGELVLSVTQEGLLRGRSRPSSKL